MPKKPSSTKKDNEINQINKLGISSQLLNDDNFPNFLQQLIDSIPLLLLVIDPHKNYSIVMANKHLAKSLNVSVEQLIGKNFLDFLPPGEIRDRRKSYADRTIQNKKPTKLIDKRGNHYFDSYTFPVFDDSEEVIYAIAIMEEITEKKDLEKTLADKEQLFSSIIQHSNDLYYIVNEKGNIIYLSPSSKKILDYKEDRIGNSIFEFLHPDDVEYAKDFFNEVKTKPGISKTILVRVKDAHGTYHYLEGIGNNQLHNDSINGIIINSRDITKRVLAQNKLVETLNYLDSIIKNSNEIIFVINKKKEIKLWNKSAEQLTGITTKKIKNRSFSEMNFIKNHADVYDFIEKTFAGQREKLREIILSSKSETQHILKPSISVLTNSEGAISDLIFICKDITNQFRLHEKFLPGSSFVIYSEDNDELKKLSKRLIFKGKKGLFISRKSLGLKSTFTDSSKLTVSLFSSLKNTEYQSIQSPEDLKKYCISFIKNKKEAVIFIDRIDYVLNRYTFQEMLTVLYDINDYVKKYHSMLFIRINKKQLTEEQASILEEEFIVMASSKINNVQLNDSLFNILKFIHDENQWNKTVNQNKIIKRFHISKLTARKRIDELLDKNLVYTKRRGRSKELYVTNKGEKIIEKRND